jgi:hypothetical protein
MYLRNKFVGLWNWLSTPPPITPKQMWWLTEPVDSPPDFSRQLRALQHSLHYVTQHRAGQEVSR